MQINFLALAVEQLDFISQAINKYHRYAPMWASQKASHIICNSQIG